MSVCFATAFILSAALTPFMRLLAIRWKVLDHPLSDVKTHKQPVPYLGGLAVALALAASLIGARLFTRSRPARCAPPRHFVRRDHHQPSRPGG